MSSYVVSRGTYNGAFCIAPASGNFVGDSTYTIDGSTFATLPTSFAAS